MLSSFRTMAKSKITLVVLFVPLALGLLVFGNMSDAFSGMATSDGVVATGSRSISSPEFKTIFDRAKAEQEQRNGGQPITNEEAAAQGGVEDILESLANQEGFLAALSKAGVHPSDSLVAQQLRKLPVFFDQVTGQFDQKAYVQRLAGEGLTPKAFEQDLRDQIAQNHFSSAVASGLRAPPVFSALAATLALEERTFSVFGLDPASIPPPAKPTDAQLNAFIKAHAAAMTEPEARSLTVVRFSAQSLAAGMPIDPADVQKRFDFRKDTLSTPEKRTVVQIPAADAQKAAAAAARLAKGEDPALVAKSLGVEPVVYTDTPRTGISDKRIADAAFSIAAGQVSPPVQGALGWAALKVVAVTPGKAVTLDQARASIEAELKAEAAQQAIYDLVEKYQTAQEGGANLGEAARAAGVTALQLPAITAQGTDRRGQPQPLMSPKLLKEAFGLAEGGESDIVTDGKGEYFAVKVDKIFPAAPPTLAAERERITAFYMRDAMIHAVEARLNGLAERVRKGESMDAVAKSVGVALQRQTIQRRAAEQDQGQARQLLARVFAAKPGEVIIAGTGMVKVEDVRIGSLQQAAVITRTAEPALRRGLFQDIGEQTFKWTRKEMKVKVDVNRARASLGLPPIEKPKASKAPAK